MSQLTVEAFKIMWKNELLPSITVEIKAEIAQMRVDVKSLVTRCDKIEQSQSFISDKYDQMLESIKTRKLQAQSTDGKIAKLSATVDEMVQKSPTRDAAIDDIQQYLRRDCLEVNGIPTLPQDNPKHLVCELSALINVDLNESDISTAHRLPDLNKVKNRIIVKFIRRDKREEFYKKREKLRGKTIKNLPTVMKEFGKSVKNDSKIYVNESLTSYRKKLFGRAYSFKAENNFKFIWTQNGKIMLREHESSRIFGFTTESQLNDFQENVRSQGTNS